MKLGEDDVIEVRHLRREDAADYAALMEIRIAVFVVEQKVPRDREVDEHEADSDFFLALLEGRPVATGRMRRDGPHLKFERIATIASMRSRGVGAALMKRMQRFGSDHFPEHLPMMHGQLSAIGFYEHLGWIAVGDVFLEESIEHRTMIRPPASPSQREALLVWREPGMEPAVRAFLEAVRESADPIE